MNNSKNILVLGFSFLLCDHLPEKYKPMNRFEKLLHSLFSASGFAEEPRLKIPFTIKKGEANCEAILENNLRYEIGLSIGLDKILNNLRGKSVVVDFDIFRALRSRLDEYGIKYTEVTGTKDRNIQGGSRLGYEITIFEKFPKAP